MRRSRRAGIECDYYNQHVETSDVDAASAKPEAQYAAIYYAQVVKEMEQVKEQARQAAKQKLNQQMEAEAAIHDESLLQLRTDLLTGQSHQQIETDAWILRNNP